LWRITMARWITPAAVAALMMASFGTQMARGETSNNRKKIDLTYVPTTASTALVIYPQRLAKSKLLPAAAQKNLSRSLLQEAGVDVSKIEQAVFLMESAPSSALAPAAIVRFVDGVDIGNTVGKALGSFSEESFQNKKYWKSKTKKAGNGLLSA